MRMILIGALMVTVVNIQAPTKELEKSKAIEMIDTLRANTPDKVELANAIVRACTVYNIPVDLMTALVFTESSFRQYAVSDKLCLGYTQVNWKVHSWIDTTQVYEANYNLMCGARILREYYDINKDWNNALLRYNGVVKGSTYPAKVNNNLDKIRGEAR